MTTNHSYQVKPARTSQSRRLDEQAEQARRDKRVSQMMIWHQVAALSAAAGLVALIFGTVWIYLVLTGGAN
jgi:hypothetical protein